MKQDLIKQIAMLADKIELLENAEVEKLNVPTEEMLKLDDIRREYDDAKEKLKKIDDYERQHLEQELKIKEIWDKFLVNNPKSKSGKINLLCPVCKTVSQSEEKEGVYLATLQGEDIVYLKAIADQEIVCEECKVKNTKQERARWVESVKGRTLGEVAEMLNVYIDPLYKDDMNLKFSPVMGREDWKAVFKKLDSGNSKFGLYIYGKTGRGKTVRMLNMMIYAKSLPFFQDYNFNYQNVKFEPTTELFLKIQGNLEKYDDLIEEYSKRAVLFLDDFGQERTTDFVQNVFSLIIDNRLRNKRPIIFTSNFSPEVWASKNGDKGVMLISRINQMCTILELEGKNLRNSI